MPIVIVIGHRSIPAAVVRFKGVMRPTLTGIGAGNDDILPSKTERPDIRRVRVGDARFDRLRSLTLRRLNSRARLRKRIFNVRVALDAPHVRASSQRLRDLPAALYQNCVNDVEGAMLEPAFTQPLQDRPLRRLAFVPQRIIHVLPLFILCRQSRRPAQVGLVGKHDKKFSLLAIGRVIDHPWRDLVRRCVLVRRATLADGARGSNRAQHSYGSCGEE